MADSNDIKITLTGEDKLSPVVQKAADNVQSSTEKMGESSEKMADDFDKNTEQVNADFDQLEKNITESCQKAEMSFESMNRKYRIIGNSMVIVGGLITAAFTGVAMSAMGSYNDLGKSIDENKTKLADLQQAYSDMGGEISRAEQKLAATDPTKRTADQIASIQKMKREYADMGSQISTISQQIATDQKIYTEQGQAGMAELSESYANMKTSATNLKNTIGEALAPVFTGLFATLNAIITPIKNFVSENRTLVTVLAAVLIPLAGIVTALGTFMLISVKVAAFLNAWKVLNSSLTISQWALNTAMLANPITWIIAAIVALIAVVVLVIKHFDTLKRWFSEGWEAIKIVFSAVWNFIKNVFVGVWHAMQTAFATVINGIMAGFEGFVNFFIKGINFIIGALNKLQVTIPSWVPGIGGDTWGINIPEIPEVKLPRVSVPAMAGGGIIYEPSLVTSLRTGQPVATVAENGPEAVGPGAGGNTFVFNFPDGLLIGTIDEVSAKLAPAMIQAFEYSRQGIVRGSR